MIKHLLFFFIIFSVNLSAKDNSDIVPILGYSDESGVILGAYYGVGLETGGHAGTSGMISKSGYRFTSNFERLPFKPSWELDGRVRLNDWEALYFGDGNQTDAENESSIFQRYGSLSLTFRNLRSKTHSLGYTLGYQWRNEQLSKQAQKRFFNDTSHIFAGFRYQIDTRDTTENASKGVLIRPSITLFPKGFGGSESTVTKLDLDLRAFYPVSTGILASRAFFGSLSGESPSYLQLYKLGSSSLLRGTQSNRYIGKSLSAFQVEYRFPIYNIVSGSLFIDAGQVADRLSIDNLHLSQGVGVHVKIGTGNAAVRFNKGFSEDHDKFIINYNHAF